MLFCMYMSHYSPRLTAHTVQACLEELKQLENRLGKSSATHAHMAMYLAIIAVNELLHLMVDILQLEQAQLKK
jgi:hypothetical protein